MLVSPCFFGFDFLRHYSKDPRFTGMILRQDSVNELWKAIGKNGMTLGNRKDSEQNFHFFRDFR
jgi:hypothetical protein